MILNLPTKFWNERQSHYQEIPVDSEFTLMEVEGPGAIRHLWMTDPVMNQLDDPNWGRDVIVRIYFDGAVVPQVECPFDDFFGLSWRPTWAWDDRLKPAPFHPIQSHYLTHAPQRSGFNAYFPMPFAQSARLTVEYQPSVKRTWWPHIYVQADIHRYAAADFHEPMRFHARWRREFPGEEFGEHFLLADIKAPGYLVGLSAGIRVASQSDHWFHAGGDFIYLDGGAESRSLHGIGMEDLFGCSYGAKPFSGPYIGCPYHEMTSAERWVGFYRFFVEDVIRFEESCRFMIGGLGNEYAGVAYWYQPGSGSRYFQIPPAQSRQPGAPLPRGASDIVETGRTAEWELVGPFFLDSPAVFDQEIGPEKDFAGRVGEEWTPKDRTVYNVWERKYPTRPVRLLRKHSYHHFLDFNATPFRPFPGAICCGFNAAAFARRTLDVPTALQTTIHLGFDDQMAVYLDGRQIYRGDHPKGFRNASVPVNLSAGPHELLVKLSNFSNTTYRNWAFCCRVNKVD